MGFGSFFLVLACLGLSRHQVAPFSPTTKGISSVFIRKSSRYHAQWDQLFYERSRSATPFAKPVARMILTKANESCDLDHRSKPKYFIRIALVMAATLTVIFSARSAAIASTLAAATDAAAVSPLFAAATTTTAAVTPLAAATVAVPAAASRAILTAATAAPIPWQLQMRFSLRMLTAALIGAAVGKERSESTQYHAAGVRTMSLVAMGAACFTICSMYGFVGHFDSSRMASSVASGVGFIGAGVITTSSSNDRMGSNSVVHGLTTAAAIWLSAAVGVACGVGMYYLSIVTGLLTITVLRSGQLSKREKNTRARPKKAQQILYEDQNETELQLYRKQPQLHIPQSVEEEIRVETDKFHKIDEFNLLRGREELDILRNTERNSSDDLFETIQQGSRSNWNSTDYMKP